LTIHLLILGYVNSQSFRPFEGQEDERFVRNINEADVQALYVGLGCQKQEKRMAEGEHRDSDSKRKMYSQVYQASTSELFSDVREKP